MNRVVEIMNLQVDGNRVTWQETYGDDSLPPTIEELELDMEAVVQDGLMQCYTAALTGDSLAKLQAAGPPPNLPESGGTVLPGYVGWLMLAGLGMVTLGWTLSRNAHNRDG